MDRPLQIVEFLNPSGIPWALLLLLTTLVLSRLLTRSLERLDLARQETDHQSQCHDIRRGKP